MKDWDKYFEGLEKDLMLERKRVTVLEKRMDKLEKQIGNRKKVFPEED